MVSHELADDGMEPRGRDERADVHGQPHRRGGGNAVDDVRRFQGDVLDLVDDHRHPSRLGPPGKVSARTATVGHAQLDRGQGEVADAEEPSCGPM